MPNYIDTGGDITARRHKGSATSKAAFERGQSTHKRDRDEVYSVVAAWSNSPVSPGITSKEVADIMDKPLHSVSGRLAELKRDGKIRETGSRRDGAAVLMVCDGEQQGLFGRTA